MTHFFFFHNNKLKEASLQNMSAQSLSTSSVKTRLAHRSQLIWSERMKPKAHQNRRHAGGGDDNKLLKHIPASLKHVKNVV